MAVESGHSLNVDRFMVDHSSKFEARFCGRTFSSYREFEEELKKFEEECLVTFRFRSSELSAPGDPCVYRRFTLLCSYGDFGKPSESEGIRKRRTKNRGCRARFSVNQRNGVLMVGKRGEMVVHNHSCSMMEYRLDPAVRRLTPEEREKAMDFILFGIKPTRVRMMARVKYNKYLTPWDVNNMKVRLVDTAVPAGSWIELEALVRQHGDFLCSRSDDGRINCISFCRTEQIELFKRYPEVVCVDATYNVNRSRFCLLQFIITDGLGHGRCIMYALMRDEKCSTYVTALLNFRDLMRNTTRLRTFMVDLSYAQMNAIRTVFGGKKILLCQFHLLRAVHRKCKNKVIWHYVKRMMGTVSVIKFNAFCQRLRRKFPGFYIYFCRVWLRHAHRWAVCYRSGTVCLGNQTNNRCESAHRWLKEDLCPADSLFNCCKRVWLSSHQMLVDYMCDVALSRIRRPVITFNNPLAGVVNRLTRYAAERIVKEWDSSNSRMSVVGVAGKFKVMEEVFTRRIAYTVDLKKVVCSCMFNQFYAMPCRHLVFAVMEAKVPIDRVLVNSRWLDCYLDGVEPPEISFTGPPHREKKVKKSVVVTRRMNQLERCMSEDTYIAMLDKVCTVMDAFEIAEIDDDAILRQKDLHEIPPLRERISQPQTSLHAASGTTIFPQHTSPPLTAFTRAQPSKLLTSATTVPRRKKVPLRRTMPVDLDVEDKENAPIPGTSYPSESQ